jgi:hypothetical protein
MNNITTADKTTIESVLTEIEEAYFDIPFGNTDFQCENFIIAHSVTPARAYRAIGLQIHSLLNQFREMLYAERLRQIEIEELQEIIANPETPKFERKRKEIALQQVLENDRWRQKLTADLIHQLNLYYDHFKRLPRYTREQFEAGERLYFEQTQNRQILGITGAKEAVMNMIDDAKTIQQFESAWAALPDDQKYKMLERITSESMAGMIEFRKE